MRVGFVEWPEGLQPSGPEWTKLADQVAGARLEILITNELPFGRWIAADPVFDRNVAQDSVAVHEAGLTALSTLPVPVILSSRPAWAGTRLANAITASPKRAVLSSKSNSGLSPALSSDLVIRHWSLIGH